MNLMQTIHKVKMQSITVGCTGGLKCMGHSRNVVKKKSINYYFLSSRKLFPRIFLLLTFPKNKIFVKSGQYQYIPKALFFQEPCTFHFYFIVIYYSKLKHVTCNSNFSTFYIAICMILLILHKCKIQKFKNCLRSHKW